MQQLLAATDPAAPLEVRLDSTYTRDAVTRWLVAWNRNAWKTAAGPVANRELIQHIDALLEGRDVTFVYVPAHQVNGDPLNAIADKAASDAARTQVDAGGAAALPVPEPVASASPRGGRSSVSSSSAKRSSEVTSGDTCRKLPGVDESIGGSFLPIDRPARGLAASGADRARFPPPAARRKPSTELVLARQAAC